MSEGTDVHCRCVLLNDCDLTILKSWHDCKLRIMQTFMGHLKVLVFSHRSEILN